MVLAVADISRGRSVEQKRQLLRAIHVALVETLRVPEGDPTVRVVEHHPDDVVIADRHSDQGVVVSITMFRGRTENTKRKLHQRMAAEIERCGTALADILTVVYELPLANWSISGIPMDETSPGFDVNV